jgi:hypothetical protein
MPQSDLSRETSSFFIVCMNVNARESVIKFECIIYPSDGTFFEDCFVNKFYSKLSITNSERVDSTNAPMSKM